MRRLTTPDAWRSSLLACVVGLAWHAPAGAGQPNREALPASGIFFDDFSYADVAALAKGGWIQRSKPGHPGIEGAQWAPQNVQLVADADVPGNRVLRLQARTDGTPAGTFQAQLCHARKYLEGTYAARVRFSDAPSQGSAGDVVIQSFYLVSPLRFDLDPQFSEIDWEYLPNGGWGDARTRLYGNAWQTVQLSPWNAYNQAHQEFRSMAGWHTLLMQVALGKTRMFIDGLQVAEHGGRTYPVAPMAIHFNLWFAPGGLLPDARALRAYQLDVDWVFHAKNRVLSPAELDQAVAGMRSAHISTVDSVAAATPELSSPCDI
jgi:hypothetical protein